MAHFKRRRATTRKEGKRLDMKKVRATEAQALRGGHPRTPRVNNWGYRTPAMPLLDETSTRQPKAKGKRRKLRNTCPGNPHGSRHHYLTEKQTEVRDAWYRPYSYTVEFTFHLCGWCGKTKRTNFNYNFGRR